MFTLLKYELKKIFSSKLVIVMLIAAVIGSAAMPIKYYISENNNDRWAEMLAYQKSLPNYEVNAETVAKAQAEIDRIENDDSSYEFIKKNGAADDTNEYGRFGDNMSPEDAEIREQYAFVYLKKEVLPEYLFLKHFVDNYTLNQENIKQGAVAAETLKKGEYLYPSQKADLHKDIIRSEYLKGNADSYKGGYAYGWEMFCKSTGSDTFITGVILTIITTVGLFGVFTNEYSSGIDSLIFSSKHGRQKSFTAVKLLASFIYCVTVLAITSITAALVCLIFAGPRGAGVSALTMYYCPYPIPMYQAALLRVALMAAGIFMSGAFTLFMSSIISNQAYSLGSCAALLLFPLMLRMLYIPGEMQLLEQFVNLTPFMACQLDVLRLDTLFCIGEWYDLKLFVPAAFAVTILIFIPVAVHVFRKRQVGK